MFAQLLYSSYWPCETYSRLLVIILIHHFANRYSRPISQTNDKFLFAIFDSLYFVAAPTAASVFTLWDRLLLHGISPSTWRSSEKDLKRNEKKSAYRLFTSSACSLKSITRSISSILKHKIPKLWAYTEKSGKWRHFLSSKLFVAIVYAIK